MKEIHKVWLQEALVMRGRFDSPFMNEVNNRLIKDLKELLKI